MELLRAAGPSLLVTAVLLAVNAFFVLAEYAIVRVRPTQLAELAQAGSRRAQLATRISTRLDAYISTVQVGVTGASLALGIIGEPTVAALLRPLLMPLTQLSEPVFHVTSFLVAYGLVTYVTLVVSELVPKYIALRHAFPLALWTAYPLELAYRLLFPFVWLVNSGATGLARLVGVTPTSELDAMSAEELKLLVAASTRRGILTDSERVLLGNALEFADKLVRQVMIPRTEVVALEADTTAVEASAQVEPYPYSRFPVYVADLDHVIGIVDRRDLAGADRPVRELVRAAMYMPETTHLDRALSEFRLQHIPMAIVLDEFGGTAGIATIEDVLEELAGEVQTGGDRRFGTQPDGSLLVDGLTSLEELRERAAFDLPDEHHDTVGGLVFGRLGRVAKVGDAVDLEGRRFRVTAMDGMRVAQVRIHAVPVDPRRE